MTDPVMIALIGAASSCALAAIAAGVSIATLLIGRRNEAHIAAAKQAIVTLEHNTNSIKDALVKVTGEAEFAKGLKIGTETSVGPPGPAGPAGETGRAGPQGETGPKGKIF